MNSCLFSQIDNLALREVVVPERGLDPISLEGMNVLNIYRTAVSDVDDWLLSVHFLIKKL